MLAIGASMADNVEECAICLRRLRHAVYILVLENGRSCRHKFHFSCLKTYVKMCVLTRFNPQTYRMERTRAVPWCPYCQQKFVRIYPVCKGAVFAIHRHMNRCYPELDWLELRREGMSELGYDGDLGLGLSVPNGNVADEALDEDEQNDTGRLTTKYAIFNCFFLLVLIFVAFRRVWQALRYTQ